VSGHCSHSLGVIGRPCPWCRQLVEKIATEDDLGMVEHVASGGRAGSDATLDGPPAATIVVPASSGPPPPRTDPVLPPADVTMPAQLSLTDALADVPAPQARAADPDTAHTAAAEQSPFKVYAGHRLVLRLLADHGPLTDFQLAHHTGKQQTSIGCRRGELVKAGLVWNTDLEGWSDSMSPAIVWALTDRGRSVWAAEQERCAA